jgi:spore germination protein GerM
MKTYSQLLLLVVFSAIALSACTSRTMLEGLTGEDSGGKVHVWFVKPVGEDLKLVEVTRPLGHGDAFKDSVEELLRGPSGQEMQAGIGSEIPKGTILLGVEKKGETIELNLSRRFASSGGSSSLETRLEQLRRTVEATAGSSKVYLDVEGERLSTTAGDGLEIKQPIN